MPLLPRWRFMTPEAKALTRRLAVSGAVILLAMLLVPGLIPWLLLGLAAWWIWRVVSR
ncbi:MAG: hypothetical protein ACO3B3_08935 [Cyanobium sp.]